MSRVVWIVRYSHRYGHDCWPEFHYYRHEKAKIATWRCELPLWWKNDKPAVSELT